MAMREWLTEALAASSMTEEAHDYLMGRGAMPEVIQEWGIKVFECPLSPCPDESKHRYYGEHFERFEGKVIYPLYSPRGHLLGFESRSVDKKDFDQFLLTESRWNPVWIGMPGGMGPVWEGKDVVVVEGVFDAFAMHHVANGRAVLGTRTAHLSWKHVEFLRRWCRNALVYMVYDRDKGGDTGTQEAVTFLESKKIPYVKTEYGVRGDDPGKIWDRGGVEALREAFQKTLPA